MKDLTFDKCQTISDGGAFVAKIYDGSVVSVKGECLFKECVGRVGGAIWAALGNDNCQLILEGDLTFDSCHNLGIFPGGAVDIDINNLGNLYITGTCTFKKCITDGTGGGMCVNCRGTEDKLQSNDQIYN